MVRKTTAVKQESETWSKVKMTEGYGTQGTLRVRSVVLFQSSYSQGLSMCIPRERKGLVLSGFFSHISIRIAVAVSTTVLVLLQVVFMGWEIVLIISAW